MREGGSEGARGGMAETKRPEGPGPCPRNLRSPETPGERAPQPEHRAAPAEGMTTSRTEQSAAGFDSRPERYPRGAVHHRRQAMVVQPSGSRFRPRLARPGFCYTPPNATERTRSALAPVRRTM